MSGAQTKPGFGSLLDAFFFGKIAGTNRRLNRFGDVAAGGGGNRTLSRHREYTNDTIAFVDPGDLITDTDNRLAEYFEPAQLLGILSSGPNDFAGYIPIVVTPPSMVIFGGVFNEPAGSPVTIETYDNQRVNRFATSLALGP